MLLLLIDLAAALACPEVQLPAGERADVWAGPLAMAGLCWTDGEPDAVLRDAGADAWLLTTDGGSVEVRRPASEAAREDLAFLAASMLRAAPSTRAAASPPPSARPYAHRARSAEPVEAPPVPAAAIALESPHPAEPAPESLPAPGHASEPPPAVVAAGPPPAVVAPGRAPAEPAFAPATTLASAESAAIAAPTVATTEPPAEVAPAPEAPTVEPSEPPVTAGWVRTGTAITTRPGATAAGALEIGAGITRGSLAANASIVATLGQHRLVDFGDEPRGWSGNDLVIGAAWAPRGALLGGSLGASRRRWEQQGFDVAAVVIPTATVDLGVVRTLGETMRAELGLRGTADLRRTELLVNDELAGVSSPWALGVRLTLAMRTP